MTNSNAKRGFIPGISLVLKFGKWSAASAAIGRAAISGLV
jgi:hypothetical protein